MSSAILDRLDRDPGGARRYLAHMFVVGGVSRKVAAAKLGEKYGVSVTPRAITTWRSKDEELRSLMAELEAVKREVAPTDSLADLLRPPRNRAQAAADIFALVEEHPAFAELMSMECERAAEAAPAVTVWGVPEDDPDEVDAPDDDDPKPWAGIHAVMNAHETFDEEFEADCRRRLGDWSPDPPEVRARMEEISAKLSE